MSETVFIRSLFLSHSLTGFRIQCLQLFAISTLKTSAVIWHLLQMKSLLFIYGYSLTGILFFSLVAFKTFLFMLRVLQYYHLGSTCELISIFPFHYSLCSLKCEDLWISLNSEMSSLSFEYFFTIPFFFWTSYWMYADTSQSTSSRSLSLLFLFFLLFSLCCILVELLIQLSRALYFLQLCQPRIYCVSYSTAYICHVRDFYFICIFLFHFCLYESFSFIYYSHDPKHMYQKTFSY